MRHLRSLPFILALLLHSTSIAGTQSAQQDESMEQPLAPTTCITSLFTKTGTSFWYNITLVLTNKCGANVDFQNVKVTFETGAAKAAGASAMPTATSTATKAIRQVRLMLITGVRSLSVGRRSAAWCPP